MARGRPCGAASPTRFPARSSTLADLGISRSDIPAIASGVYVREQLETGYTRGRVVGLTANQNQRHIAA